MTSSSDVHIRICGEEITKRDLAIKALIQDIRECCGPLSTLAELNTLVKANLDQLRLRIQDLEQMSREQNSYEDTLAIQTQTESHLRHMLNNQAAWRKANLACKLAIDHAEKEELLRGGRDGPALRQRTATKDSLVRTSSDITDSLMSICRMMDHNVKQSVDAIGALATSSRTIQETNEEFRSMAGTIHLGRKLLLKYNRRELTDKLFFFLALMLYLFTVLYIIKKRLFSFI